MIMTLFSMEINPLYSVNTRGKGKKNRAHNSINIDRMPMEHKKNPARLPALRFP